MISAVIPLFNEETNCLDFTIRLARQLSKLTNDWEMVLMIGGHDQTLNLLSRLWNGYKRVKIVYEAKRGLGTALKKGFFLVSPNTDWILTMDGDGQNLPEEIPKLIDSRFDIVVGEHQSGQLGDNRSTKRKLFSKLINWFFRNAYGTGLYDHTSNFRLYKAGTIFAIRQDLKSKNFEIEPEILIRAHRLGFVAVEETINFAPRNGGWSKLSVRKSLIGYGLLVLRLFP